MYIESSNIGSDYVGTEFINYLGFIYLEGGWESEVDYIIGMNNTIAYGLTLNYFGGASPHYSVDRMSSFGSTMFTCEEGFGRMIMNQTKNYKVVSSSVVMGALANGDSLNLKPYLMAELVYDFIDFNPAVSISENPGTTLSSIRAFPNPMFTETTIEYQLQNTCRVKVSIFDSQARLVNTIFEGKQPEGKNKVKWNAKNSTGTQVEPGNYFYIIESANKRQNGKISVL